MDHPRDFATVRIDVHKPSGTTAGPYMVAVSPDKIICFEKEVDFDTGDKISRVLPNGKVEAYYVVETHYHEGRGHGGVDLSNWEVTTSRTPPAETSDASSDTTTYHVHAQNVQIGDGNMQSITNALGELMAAIDSSTATPEEKKEAKGRFRKALEHPILLSIVGGASGAFFKSVFGGSG